MFAPARIWSGFVAHAFSSESPLLKVLFSHSPMITQILHPPSVNQFWDREFSFCLAEKR